LIKQSKTASKFSKALSLVSIVTLAAEVGQGIYSNIKQGSGAKKTIIDATVDLSISGSSMLIAGGAGALAGFVLGTSCPVLGNVVGSVVGFSVGVALYWATDMAMIDDRTVRDITKDYYNSIG